MKWYIIVHFTFCIREEMCDSHSHPLFPISFIFYRKPFIVFIFDEDKCIIVPTRNLPCVVHDVLFKAERKDSTVGL